MSGVFSRGLKWSHSCHSLVNIINKITIIILISIQDYEHYSRVPDVAWFGCNHICQKVLFGRDFLLLSPIGRHDQNYGSKNTNIELEAPPPLTLQKSSRISRKNSFFLFTPHQKQLRNISAVKVQHISPC